MSDAEIDAPGAEASNESRRNFFDEFAEEEAPPDSRARLLHLLTDTGDVLEDIEEHCVALVRAIESSSLTAGDAARLKKRVWRIEDLTVKAAEKINGRHTYASL